MNSNSTVILFGYCQAPHASQIYTGFYILSQNKNIKLKQEKADKIQEVFGITPTPSLMASGVFATIDGITVFFDFLDSAEVETTVSKKVKIYFKRSLAKNAYPVPNMYPLGLNFEIYNKTPHIMEVRRLLKLNWSWKSSLKHKLSTLADAAGIGFLPRTSYFEKKQHSLLESSHDVLFLARTWDPKESGISLSSAEREDRHQINLSRAKLIRALKDKLGERFLGGFSCTTHSRQEFPDIILNDRKITKKENYLRTVSTIPICITTTGLHGSIGWKFAEYIALGRAVVAEETNVLIPHNFEEGKNYLSFRSVEESLNKIDQLLENRNLRESMMRNNHQYYINFLKPEKVVTEVIRIIQSF